MEPLFFRIHGMYTSSSNNPIYELVKQLQLEILYVGGDSSYIGGKLIPQYYSDGKICYSLTDEERNNGFKLVEEIFDELDQMRESRLTNKLPDIPIAKATEDILAQKNVSQKDRAILAWHEAIIFGGDFATDTARISLYHAVSDDYIDFEGGDSVLIGGFVKLVSKLAENIHEIKTSCIVNQISIMGNSKVEVKSNQGIFIADAVLVTVPLGVLKSGMINFIPDLPSYKQEIISNELDMGTLNRLILEFEECFWDASQYTYGYIADDTEGIEFPMIINMMKETGKPILLFMLAGSDALRIEKLDIEQIVDKALIVLNRMFSNVPKVKSAHTTKWSQDPFTFGSYSFPKVGASLDCFDKLAEPVNDLIFFAGEHTILNYYGTVHGAYLSGCREASRIASLNKNK